MTPARSNYVPPATGTRATLTVDPIRCTGHGMCAELFPEQIALDDWGYPMIDPSGVPYELREHAERAVKACPVLALRLQQAKG